MRDLASTGRALAGLALACVAVLAVPLAGDQLLLRHWYVRWLEPESTAGQVMLAPEVVDAQWRPDRPNVLVVGDSRVAEGFSAALANAGAAGQRLNFIWLGMPGTTPRVWSLLLRRLDPERRRFRAVYLMAPSLRDSDVLEDLGNRTLDNAYLAPVLRLQDLWAYAGSFALPDPARQARDAVLFPASTLQADMAAFLRSPRRRIDKVRQWRSGYPRWQHDYAGHEGALPPPPQPFDRTTLLAQMDGPLRAGVATYLEQAGRQAADGGAASAEYRRTWYGRIAAWYAASQVRLGVFLVPRGPYHLWLDHPADADGALAALARQGALQLLPVDGTLALEQPQFFFDQLHLNTRGRAAFTATLSAAVARDLGLDLP